MNWEARAVPLSQRRVVHDDLRLKEKSAQEVSINGRNKQVNIL
jgi:hypothetical protein